MSDKAKDHKPKPMSLEECVSAFLKLAMVAPETPPKRVRDQESNRWTIHGFNRGQETLREILETHGKTPRVRELAEVRSENQQRPQMIGGRRLWVM